MTFSKKTTKVIVGFQVIQNETRLPVLYGLRRFKLLMECSWDEFWELCRFYSASFNTHQKSMQGWRLWGIRCWIMGLTRWLEHWAALIAKQQTWYDC
jgi:hypothetical protein